MMVPFIQGLLGRLNLRPGEGRLVVLLVALSFFQGWALVLVDTASMALFLGTIGAAALPGVYLGSALVLPLAGVTLSWVGQRMMPERLAVGAFFLFAVLLLLLWAGAALSEWAFFGLLIWYRTYKALVVVVFWGVAGRLMNVRQTKRLYGVVGSGENAARVLGYALIPLFISALGVTNLLLLGAIGLVGALVLSLAIGRFTTRVRLGPASPGARERPLSLSGMRELLASPYPLLILAIIALSSWAFSALDLASATQLEQRFPDTATLASFLAGLSLLLSVVRLIGTPLLTAPLIRHYGITFGLFAQPVIIAIGMSGALASAVLWPAAVFWLVVGGRVLDSALSTMLLRPTTQILLQPLPTGQRLATQSFADGVIGPLALAVFGLLGLAIGGASTLIFAGLALAFACAWMLVAAPARRAYLRALGQSLTRRFGSGEAADLADPAALALARRTLASPHRGEVLYAVELLADHQPSALEQARATLLAHGDPVVRQALLEQIARGRLQGDRHELAALVTNEQDAGARGALIAALCATAESDAVEMVAPYVDDPIPAVRHSAMVGLLRHGGIVGILAAGPRLVAMGASGDPDERTRAALVASELGSPDYFQPLRPLFADPNPAVRRAVLIAAGQVRSARLVPRQIEALSDPSTAAAAAYSLELAGPIALPALTAALPTAGHTLQILIAGVLGRIGGEHAIAALQTFIGHADAGLRGSVYKSLETAGYNATGSQLAQVRSEIVREAGEATWFLAAIADLDTQDDGLVIEALAADLEQARERMLHLLAFLGNPEAIAAARTSLAQGTHEQRANAVEIIDVLLGAALKPAVLPLFDDLKPAEQLLRLRAHAPHPPLGRAVRLAELAGTVALPAGVWSRNCARYILARELHDSALGGDHTLAIVGRVAALRRAELFADTPGATLAALAERMVTVEVQAGGPIFAQGDVGDALYIVVVGAVRIFTGAQTLNTMRPGEVFGEMAVLDPAPRAASAEALEPTRLLRLDRHDLDAVVEERPEILRTILRTITRNLRANLTTLATLRSQLAA